MMKLVRWNMNDWTEIFDVFINKLYERDLPKLLAPEGMEEKRIEDEKRQRREQDLHNENKD